MGDCQCPQDEPCKILELISKQTYRYYNKDEIPVSDITHILPSFGENNENICDNDYAWVQENYDQFLEDTPNEELADEDFLSEMGHICCMDYSPDGEYIAVGHSTGLVQIRDGKGGNVITTLRPVQFPPVPVHAIAYSTKEKDVCYAACADGRVRRFDLSRPASDETIVDPLEVMYFNEKEDSGPNWETFIARYCQAVGNWFHINDSDFVVLFHEVKNTALSFGLNSDESHMAIGASDASVRIFDMTTQSPVHVYRAGSARMSSANFKLRRMHSGRVCALRCHPDHPNVLASGAWDDTVRIWDMRVKVGCVMTFEHVNVCGDAIDLNRNLCVTGAWTPTESLHVWDITAHRQLHLIKVQNRRVDVDGEYVYTARFWRSSKYNRKGKYIIAGGSGVNCLEVINKNNRYIACAYPVLGTVQAITSCEDRIAFGGNYTKFNIVTFHDPEHGVDTGSGGDVSSHDSDVGDEDPFVCSSETCL